MVKPRPLNPAPIDASDRRAIPPVVCYPVRSLSRPDVASYRATRASLTLVESVVVPPREARCFEVPAGHFFQIHSVEGSQVGDLNLWNSANLNERFYSGKTRALNGTHVGLGDQLFSSFPYLRPLATITHDSLDWYGFDEFGAGCHDVIGTRCDPYTHSLLSGGSQFHHCCHSNLTRALANHLGTDVAGAESHVHDVLNVFMCTGFKKETGEYFMKASPVRPGDYLEMFAEIDLLAALSACPGGDCSAQLSSDTAECFPLRIDIYKPAQLPAGWSPPEVARYDRTHGRRTLNAADLAE